MTQQGHSQDVEHAGDVPCIGSVSGRLRSILPHNLDGKPKNQISNIADRSSSDTGGGSDIPRMPVVRPLTASYQTVTEVGEAYFAYVYPTSNAW